MRFHARKRLRFGPFYVVLTEHGLTSWGIRVWRYTRNFTRGTSTFDTPGPGAVYFGKRRR